MVLKEKQMKSTIKKVFYGLLLAPLAQASAADIWTADISSIYVHADDKAKVYLTNLKQGPAGQSSTVCTSNAIWLSPQTTTPAKSNVMSLALTMYATKKPIRIAFNGSGNDCVLINMGIR
jgi:hypothetical protein